MVAIPVQDERICEDRNGYYSLLFSNSNNLELYEIEGIFGEFGKVLSVRQANHKGGIHFVSFESYDEAKNAVEGLMDDPDIHLRVYRNKGKHQLSNNRRRENFNESRYYRNNDNNHSWINGSHYRSAPRDFTIDDRRYNRNNDNNHSSINGSHYRSAPRNLSHRFDKARSIETRRNTCDDYHARDKNVEYVTEEISGDENMNVTIHRWHRVSEKKVKSTDSVLTSGSNESLSLDVVDDEIEGRNVYDDTNEDSSSLNNMQHSYDYQLSENVKETINATIDENEKFLEREVIDEESDVVATVDDNESVSVDVADDENEGRNVYDDTNEELSSLNNNMQKNLTYDYQLSENVEETINATIDESEKVVESVMIDEQSDVVATVDDNESVLSLESVEMIIEKASEVIIGNVDLERTNEAYLLHLFDKYEPIAVSQLMPITPHDDLGYCSIYFKNHEIAVKVEKNFDKMCLDGRQIIVQRPNRLFAAYLQRI